MKSVWVNGCFDVLHVGHVKLLQFAKSKGDRLVVGLDSDERITKAKGKKRPFNFLQDRIEMLNALKCVDSVVSFDSDEELRSLLSSLKINIMVVGKEYQNKEVIGSEIVNEVIFFDKIGNYSTTEILEYGTQD